MCNKQNMPKLLRQLTAFLFVSGIGWLLDFGLYTSLTQILAFAVLPANVISSVPAVLWVFWFSSKKIFEAKPSRMTLYQKSLLYFLYQFLLIGSISLLAGYLYQLLLNSPWSVYRFLVANGKILIKIAITPITMTANFIVMKEITQRL